MESLADWSRSWSNLSERVLFPRALNLGFRDTSRESPGARGTREMSDAVLSNDAMRTWLSRMASSRGRWPR